MNTRKPRWLAPAAPGPLAAVLFVLFASISPCRGQLEPEVFTASREFNKAMSSNPPDVSGVVKLLIGYDRPLHRQTLQSKWVDHLMAEAKGTSKEKHRQLTELFDAFEDAFGGRENTKQRAERFLEIRDQLLGRTTPKKQIEKSAMAFLEQLSKLPKAQRDLLKEFGRQAKAKTWANSRNGKAAVKRGNSRDRAEQVYGLESQGGAPRTGTE